LRGSACTESHGGEQGDTQAANHGQTLDQEWPLSPQQDQGARGDGENRHECTES
jgi:hypothetical protein